MVIAEWYGNGIEPQTASFEADYFVFETPFGTLISPFHNGDESAPVFGIDQIVGDLTDDLFGSVGLEL